MIRWIFEHSIFMLFLMLWKFRNNWHCYLLTRLPPVMLKAPSDLFVSWAIEIDVYFFVSTLMQLWPIWLGDIFICWLIIFDLMNYHLGHLLLIQIWLIQLAMKARDLVLLDHHVRTIIGRLLFSHRALDFIVSLIVVVVVWYSKASEFLDCRGLQAQILGSVDRPYVCLGYNLDVVFRFELVLEDG